MRLSNEFSEASPPSGGRSDASPQLQDARNQIDFRHTAAVFVFLVILSASAAIFCAQRGYTLYYGDAEAHLNIARRVFDSRTPGPEQLGTVWLPLPHMLMIPFVGRDDWWRSGIAGVIPSAACFVIAGMFLFAAAHRVFASSAAAIAAVLFFALNPNMLYLQSVPMTEAVFAAALAALLWSTVAIRESSTHSQSLLASLFAGFAAAAAALTRYEGWFLIPFAAVYLFFTARKKWHAALFIAVAGLGPLSWLAHNQYYYSNPLEFYNGEYSAQAIYARQLAAGVARYPGDHDWRTAIEYYSAAVRWVVGRPLLLIAAAGLFAALSQALRPLVKAFADRRAPSASGRLSLSAPLTVRALWWPFLLLALPPLFYVWSMHSGGTPLYVPDLWPNTWYNTRYALAALPLASFAAAALVAVLSSVLGPRSAWPIGIGLAGATVLFWLAPRANPLSICWKESEVNSNARRQWTAQAADYLAAHRKDSSTILLSFGDDLPGILRVAGIPIREALHDGNHPAWDATIARPELLLNQKWAIAVEGSAVSGAILRAQKGGPHYELVKRIIVEGAPAIDIFERQPSGTRD